MHSIILIPTLFVALVVWWWAKNMWEWRPAFCGLLVIAVLVGGIRLNARYTRHLASKEAANQEAVVALRGKLHNSVRSWVTPEAAAQPNYAALADAARRALGLLASSYRGANSIRTAEINARHVQSGPMVPIYTLQQVNDMADFLSLLGVPVDPSIVQSAQAFISLPDTPGWGVPRP